MFSFFFDLKKIQKIQLYLAFWYHSVATPLALFLKVDLKKLLYPFISLNSDVSFRHVSVKMIRAEE